MGSPRRWKLSLYLIVLAALPAAAQARSPKRVVLMDIDGTQVRRQVNGRGNHKNALRLRQRLIEAKHLLPGYITGRTIEGAQAALSAGRLIARDAAVPYGIKITQGGVDVRGADGKAWPGWREVLSSLSWNKSKINELLDHALLRANARLGEELITRQPEANNGDFRAGIFFAPELRARYGDERLARYLVESIVEPLAQNATVLHELETGHYKAWGARDELRVATVVYKSNSVAGRLNVDFVPVTSEGRPLDKLAAMKWVTRRLGLAADAVAFAGDAHNDPLLRAARDGFKVIVVGNAPKELKEQLVAEKSRGRDNIHVAENHDAAGVLEGLERFGFLGNP